MKRSEWRRVTKQHRCPICGKPDWCCYTADGSVVMCMRVESDHPCKGDNGGWIHRMKTGGVCRVSPSRIYAKPEEEHIPARSAESLIAEWKKNTLGIMLAQFASELGVTRSSLERLGCVWNAGQSCWAFPMLDETGKVIGIRLRSKARKYSVTKSRTGLFFDPGTGTKRPASSCAWLTEGPTDTAALLSMGARTVIGRSDLTSGWKMLKLVLERLNVSCVNICVDNELEYGGRADCPGWKGNRRMAKALGLPCKFVQVPGFKDIREYAKSGGTLKELGMILGLQKYRVPK